MSNYENAPATILLATHCCVCGRPLCDSDSVEIGIGPTCRGKSNVVDGPVDWNVVCDELGKFAAMHKSDPAAVCMFERAMLYIGQDGMAQDVQGFANVITHYIAAVGTRFDPQVGNLVGAIRAMGRTKLADILAERLYPVRLVLGKNGRGLDTYFVHTPYNDSFRAQMRSSRTGWWNKECKAYEVVVPNKHKLYQILKVCYAGLKAFGPKGEFAL